MSRRLGARAAAKAAEAPSAETDDPIAPVALCEAAVQELVDLVLECGGMNDQEALLLLAILSRLKRVQSAEGPRAAWAAAREIRQIWLAGDEDERPAAVN
ncbi:MAG TPA: hypothetical protein VLI41_13720 [Phenylobacterium sp.]|uniref:hypothetical protein n=1 Tax=Phenylobacterium sp. TaxID=1871053 RepID=UPI002BD78ECD|nr:hypothetical protein [Phenylobacterium sp.]HSV04251.1 hypothetical protein [Phenylobacterium sp.]